MAIKIIENSSIDDLDNIYKLITKRLITGFVFDVAPSCNNKSISFLKYNNNLSINLDLNKDDEFDENHLTNNNILILGENYDALKNLLLTHKNKIDVIYIDPPYNTDASLNEKNNLSEDEILEKNSNKFVYRDKFSRTGWLNMIQDRLYLAKDLLKDDGVIFVSIDDSEQAYLKVLMDQIFGEDNFIANIIFDKTSQGATLSDKFKRTHEYILLFQKSNKFILNLEKKENIDKYKECDHIGKYAITNKLNSINSYLEQNKNRGYTIYYNEMKSDCQIRFEYDLETLEYNDCYDKNLINDGYIAIRPGNRKNKKTCWNWSAERFLNDWKNEIIFKKDNKGKLFPYHKNRINEYKNPFTIVRFDSRKEGAGILEKLFGEIIFNFSKPLNLIKWLIDRHKNKNAIVLDFFAGSGTTGQAVMELNQEDGGNRRFILCTNNEEIYENKKPTGKFIGTNICYERLYRVINGKGTKNEKIKWKYSNEKPSLTNNSLLVFDINYANVNINIENFKSIYEQIIKSEKIINNTFDCSEESLIKKLYSLHPLRIDGE